MKLEAFSLMLTSFHEWAPKCALDYEFLHATGFQGAARLGYTKMRDAPSEGWQHTYSIGAGLHDF